MVGVLSWEDASDVQRHRRIVKALLHFANPYFLHHLLKYKLEEDASRHRGALRADLDRRPQFVYGEVILSK